MEPAVAPAKVFRFGVFEAEPAQNTLTRKGIRVRIQDQPFRALVLLIERPGEIVAREELRQNLWPDGTYVDFDGSLNAILKKLRSALDDDPESPRFIETVPRRGYRFIAPVSVVTSNSVHAQGAVAAGENGNATAAASPPVATPGPGDPVARSAAQLGTSKRSPLLIYVAALLILAIAVGAWVVSHRRSSNAEAASGSPARLPVPMRKSVAVLGFHNVSGRVSDSWLGTAFSEMLSTELAAGEKLRLVSGEDVANVRLSSPWSQTDTLDQATTSRLGNALSSDYLVLGSYTTTGDPRAGKLRVDVRLQDARTGEIVQEDAETGSSEDLSDVVSRAGEKLRDRLGLPQLAIQDQLGVLAAVPRDREAARLYSLGVLKLRQFDFLGARDLLQEAVKSDPNFSLGHLMLAQAWAGLGFEHKRKEEAKKALDLSTDLPRTEQLLVQGNYFESLPDHERSASVYRVLFELFPDNAEYGLLLANAQHSSGHDGQAATTISQLRQLPPPESQDPRIDLLDAFAGTVNEPKRLRLVQSAEQKAQSQGKSLLYAQARENECLILNYGQQPNQATPACQDAYNIYLGAGNRLMAADTLRMMADTEGTLGHLEQAIAIYRHALRLLAGMGEHRKTGSILNNMAIGYENEGKLDQAEQFYRQAKQHFEQAGDKGNTATALGNIADVLFLRGELAAAATMYQRSMELENSLDHGNPIYVLYRLSDLELVQGHVHEAHRLAQQAIDSGSVQQGSFQYFTSAMSSLGRVLEAEGDLQGARKKFEEILQIRQKARENELVGETQAELADLDLQEGHVDRAEPLLRTVIAEFEKEHENPDAASAYTLLSTAMLMQGKIDAARGAIQRAIDLSQISSDPALKIPASIQAARVEITAADPHKTARARQALRSAIANAKKLGYYDLECEAGLALAEADIKANAAYGRTELNRLAAEVRTRGFELLARRAERMAANGAEVVAMTNSAK